MKQIEVLGNGQIWDVKGIDKNYPELIFEDVFSGRALEQLLGEFETEYVRKNKKRIFSDYLYEKRLRGMAVTKALLSGNTLKIRFAKHILAKLGENGAKGIAVLNRGIGSKAWDKKNKDYWKNIDNVIIGGGVSKDNTGRVLISAIKKNLVKNGLKNINIFQAKFSGKESGFLGAVVNLLPIVFKNKNNKLQAVIGLDLGRDKIGAGFVAVDTKKEKILTKENDIRQSIIVDKTPGGHDLRFFLDSKRKYTKKEISLGIKIRRHILEKIAEFIKINIENIRSKDLIFSGYIGISVPGEINKNGDIIGSTDYLPFLRLKDKFHFKNELKKILLKQGVVDPKVFIINDGIAAGISNSYFDNRINKGKVIFLGVGSGLGGFCGRIK